MIKLTDLTVVQLQRAIDIKVQIEKLQSQLDSIEDGGEAMSPASDDAPAPARRKYHMTAAHKRKLIKALARARAIRWAKYGGKGAAKTSKPAKKDGRSSPATRAKLAAAARKRWRKARAAGKTTL